MKKKPEDYKNHLEEDSEDKKYRASAKYAELASWEEDKALDDDLGLEPISIRLQKTLVAKLKIMAKEEGLGYQPYIRQILTKHAKKMPSATRKKRAGV